MKRFLLLGVVILLFGLLLRHLVLNGQIRFDYPDKNEYPVLGIDVSHHQGMIRWEELRSEGISFVIIKATEGGDFKDSLFQKNWANSKKEGYKTGAYHFYRFCKNGKEQAKNFIETVPFSEDNLPPTVDLEFGGNCKTDKSKEQILVELGEFMDILREYYHKKPIIYATSEFYEQYLINNFIDYPLWIRSIIGKPRLSGEREWLIWQFFNRGHLNGIDTYVDLNVLNGKTVEVFH
jgi:lysozyme